MKSSAGNGDSISDALKVTLAAKWPKAVATTFLSVSTSIVFIGYFRGDPAMRILIGVALVATVAVSTVLIRSLDRYCGEIFPGQTATDAEVQQ
jgi:hypothetical protein